MAKVKIIQAWHNRLHSIISTLDHSSTATSGRILKADGNGLPIESANTDAELADAVAKRHTQGTDTALGVLGTKNPPIDADKVVQRDSAAGDALVTSTWAQIKAFLKTYFDTVYGAIGLAHARLHSITSALDHSSAATPGKMLKADANGLPVDASNTDGQVAAAVAASHARQHSIIAALDHTSAATPGKILQADANGLPIDAANTNAEVTDAVAKRHTQGTDVALGAVATKNPPIDADKALYRDSAAGDALVTSTWTQIKAFLKLYFDTLYAAIGLAHARLHSITSILDHSSAATPGRILKADANGLPIDGTNTNADVADAVSKKHTQGTDVALGAVGVKNPPINADKAMYRDSAAADALVTSTWTQIKAFLKTYWDTLYEALGSVATHAALTTGIHGITLAYPGESSVQGLNLASHKTRHEFNGADELLLTYLLGKFIQVTFDWQTHDAWTEAHSGSGYITWNLMNTLLRTGATINSIVKAYTAQMGVGYWAHPGRIAADAWSIDSYSVGLADSLVWLGFFADVTPGNTVKHVGWKIIDGEIWASNSDGVNQTITDTGVSMADASATERLLINATNTAINFYINLVLKATHTTNLPGGGMLRNMMYITNTVASERIVRVFFVTVSMLAQY